jgi:hypothetical protein
MVLSIRPRRDLAVRLSQTETRVKVLLRHYGFRVCGDRIIQVGVGFTRDTVFGRCRSVWDAAEQLRPVIADAAYSDRLARITAPTN